MKEGHRGCVCPKCYHYNYKGSSKCIAFLYDGCKCDCACACDCPSIKCPRCDMAINDDVTNKLKHLKNHHEEVIEGFFTQ